MAVKALKEKTGKTLIASVESRENLGFFRRNEKN
jgi:hypothetical protein